jgi:hypothetical protein
MTTGAPDALPNDGSHHYNKLVVGAELSSIRVVKRPVKSHFRTERQSTRGAGTHSTVSFINGALDPGPWIRDSKDEATTKAQT